ncbi:MAG: thioredoxin domain-containing protein [Acidobacteria bacterium]|nr:thioredoxin domain-containing protein [Acidobacteriota bacterium]
MKKHSRTLIIILSALGLAASVAALYVHYWLLADPSYTSFCDVSETVSCEAVLTSRYGSLFGVPVAVGGAIWSALVLMLGALGMRSSASAPVGPGATGPAKAGRHDRPAKAAPSGVVASGFSRTTDDRSGRVAGYIFILSTVGLAAVLYLGYASFFVLRQACPLCMAMYVAVIGLFIVSGGAASDLSMLPRAFGRDVRAVTSNPLASALAVVLVAASIGLVLWFPREEPVAETAAAAPVAPPPTEALGPEETEAFEAWLSAQPRVQLDVPSGGARVVVVKFNDYQCPACRQAYIAYKAIQQNYESQYPGQVAFVSVDYPLEAECNTGGIHAAACEAAVAVRLARTRNRAAQMEEWLFDNQPGMTRDTVKQALADIAQVTDFDAQYAKVLDEVRKDAQLGQKLQINGTPTFFINGIRIASTLRPAYFDAAIAYELKRTQAATP